MCDGQPAAQLSSMIDADNQQLYQGKKETPFPDELFPDNIDSKKNDDFEDWFNSINSRFGFIGKGKSDDTGSRFYIKCMVFPGGFHARLKLHNCCGMIFGNFLQVFFV